MNRACDLNQPDIDGLKANDERAWGCFFSEYEREIRAVAAWPKWHFDAHTREDVVQIIKVAIVQSIENLHSEQALRAFVRKICVHRCIDMLRRKLREKGRLLPLGRYNDHGEWENVDVVADDEFDPVSALLRIERVLAVRAALAQLDESCQQMISQFYVDNLSYREIAEVEGISINTVGSRLSRCLNKLRPLLNFF